MKLKEIISEIEKKFVSAQAEDFDNVGLLCGNPDREISGILVCHDSLEAVVDEAVAKQCNLIFAFHPIIFSGLKSLTGKNYVERTVLKAIENKIAIYAIHTAWDNDYFGVNFRICEELGLVNQKILMPKQNNLKQLAVFVPRESSEVLKNAMFAAGAGKIGFYDDCSFALEGTGTFRPLPGSDPVSGSIGKREDADEVLLYFIFEKYKQNNLIEVMKKAHPYEEVAYQIYSIDNENQYSGLGRYGEFENPLDETEFLQLVKDKFQIPVIKHSELTGKKIKRVGVLGGSGASGIKAAKSAKCDAYITGDLKYHDYFQAEKSLLLCDAGHFESERWVVTQLVESLSEIFPKFAVSISETNTNPVNYFI